MNFSLWELVAVLLVAIIVGWWDIAGLPEGRRRREVAAYMALLLVCTSFTAAVVADLPVPRPYQVLAPVFMPIGDWVRNLLT